MSTVLSPAPAKPSNPFAAAKIHLSLHHPFFATLAFHLVAVPKPADWFMAHGAPAPTAAVDGKRIYYFPPFVEKLTPKQRIGLLCHEILHAALGHLWRRGNRVALLWKIATDFAVNSTILRTTVRKKRGPNDWIEEPAFELPPGGLHERRFDGMGAEQIYAILRQEIEEHRKDCPKCQQQQACKDGQPQHGHEPMDGQLEHAVPDEEEQKEKAKRRQERREKRKQEAEERRKQAEAEAAAKAAKEQGEEKGDDKAGAGAKDEKPESGDEPKDEQGEGQGEQESNEQPEADASGDEEKDGDKDEGEASGEDEGEDEDDGDASGADDEESDEDEGKDAGAAQGGQAKHGPEAPASHQQPAGEGGDWDADEGDLDDIEDMEDLADHWRGLLNQAALVAKARGNLPADLERLIKDVAEPKVPWQEVVSHWTNEILRDDYDMQVSDRRFIQHGIYLPDLHSDARSIMVVIDVSGSIGEKELAAFVGEVTGILRCQGVARVRLMACDAAVTFDQTFGPCDDLPEKFPGGGGTDFRPPFKRLQDGEGDFRPAGVIYLTDMCGTFPSEDPGVPTIWLASCPPYMKQETMPQAPFGLTITYDPLTDAEPEIHVAA